MVAGDIDREAALGQFRRLVRVIDASPFREALRQDNKATGLTNNALLGAFGDWLAEQGEDEAGAFFSWYAQALPALRVKEDKPGRWSVLARPLPPGMADAVTSWTGWGLRWQSGRRIGPFHKRDSIPACLLAVWLAVRSVPTQ